jgi:hypothetical protein
MVDMLLKALDRIIDLLRIREKRMQKRFDQIWKPTYNDLLLVHADYYSMFQTVYSLIAQGSNEEKEGGSSWRWEAIQYIKKKRVEFAPIRQKLTALEFKKDERLVELWTEEERHFLAQVTHYIRIKSLQDDEFHKTRSADLLVDLEQRLDGAVGKIVLEVLEERITRLGEDWIDVSRSFNALQVALIQQST